MQNLNPFAWKVRQKFVRDIEQLQFDITQHAVAPLELGELRTQIDAIDESIIALIGQRFALVQQIGSHKRVTQQAVLDPKRETELFLRLNELEQRHRVPIEVVTHLYDFLMTESKQQQATASR
jgi:chorismate mutase